MNEFQKALKREVDLWEIEIRTIGTSFWPYPTLPLFCTKEERDAVDAEYRRLVEEYDNRD